MTVEKTELANNVLMITLSGRLDVGTTQIMRNEISSIPEKIERVILDIRDLSYISSAGLREVLICRKKYPGDRMKVINASSQVFEIFETTGFDSLVPVHKATKEATYVNLSFEKFLDKKVSESGEKIVLRDHERSYTYLDIEKGAQIIANDLHNIGVTKGSHVGICGANSARWIMTFFAVQKLEAMAMLINPAVRSEELIVITDIGDIRFLCCGDMAAVEDIEGAVASCPKVEKVYRFGSGYDVYERFGEYDAVSGLYKSALQPDDPALVIFTSGSTGRPKGVLLSSYNVLNAASANSKDQTLSETDRTCLILPLFHIFGLVAGLFASLIADATLVIPKDIRTDTLLSVISENRCTFFHSVPTMLIALMKNKNFDPLYLRTLRGTIISGAAATKAQIEMFQEALPNDNFFASYGLSEMAPVSITPYGDSHEHVTTTVGKPVNNIDIKIVDRATEKECEPGVSGEILVQGFNLMVGYYKVPLEDQAIDEEGWLHTGDIGFIDEDGYLHLSGRIKELIIRGGENIMPAEVENAISSLKTVHSVKVIGVPSEFFGEEVAACIIPEQGIEFDEEDMRQRLSEHLAKFKIPAYYVLYDEFPVLGTGKIDAVALKADALKRLGKDV